MMIIMESSTIAALLSYSPTARRSNIQETLPKFSSPLKENFENRSLWLRFGLTLSLSHESPRSAIQAFNECLRIDQYDPLPAMLAAKLTLEALDDPDDALEFAKLAIERCQRLADPEPPALLVNGDHDSRRLETLNLDCSKDQQFHNETSPSPTSPIESVSTTTTIASKQHSRSTTPIPPLQPISKSPVPPPSTPIPSSSSHYLEAKCCYKNIAPLLSKCYLLASIMHAHIYEREPESIRQFRNSNLQASLYYLGMAADTNSQDHLIHFHKALHDARQGSYSAAIDNLRQAIKLNPYHVPSIQLLILSLSALKLHDEALVLCESTLHQFEDNLLLLYIKCNLEQCLVETKGYKTALDTAQQMLKCIRGSNAFLTDGKARSQKSELSPESQPGKTQTTPTSNINTNNNSGSSNNNNPNNNNNGNNHIIKPRPQTTNLFADEKFDARHKQDFITEELSVWLLVAEIFVKIGSLGDAERCVDEGSTHINGALSHQIMFVRGLISKAKNNLIESKSFFQSCLALCPRHAKALQQVAHVHYLLGNHSTAEKFLKDSLDVNGDCFRTWHYLSLVFIETNQHEKASECAKKAASLENSTPIIPISAISRLTLD